jgi:glycosyltransferase involved in cell wall biosynthesis
LVDDGEWQMLQFFGDHLQNPIYSVLDQSYVDGSSYQHPLDKQVDVRPLNTRAYNRWSRWMQARAVRRHYERLADEADLFLIRLPAFHALAAWRVAQRRSIPYCVSLHGHWDRIFTQAPRRGLVRALYDRLMVPYVEWTTRRVLEDAEHVFFLGQTLADRYADAAGSSSVISHFVHDPADVGSGLSVPTSGGPMRVLFVGQLLTQKGIYVLLESARRLVEEGLDIVLEFAGSGAEEENLRRLNEEGPLRGRLELLGWLAPGKPLDEAFARATVFCLPSFSEGVPKVVMEALVRGVPVVASRVGDVGRLLGDDERGWTVEPENTEALTEALREALCLEPEREKRANSGLLFAKEHTRDEQVARIGEVLTTVAPRLVASSSIIR